MAAPLAPRFPALDGIRGLAVVVVVVHNVAWIGARSEQFIVKLFSAAAAAGWVGVQLFFVLSGLLITSILLDTRDDPDYFRRFYLRRTLRIFPLYYAFLAFMLLVVVPAANDPAWSASAARDQWAYWLYVSNWTEPLGGGIRGLSHLWSLAVEEQFYLAWPLLVWWLGPRGIGRLSLAMVLSGPLVRLAMHLAGMPAAALYSFTIARWDALAAGALLAVALRDVSHRAALYRALPAVASVSGSCLVALILRQRGFHDNELPIQVIGQSLISVLSACLLAWGMNETPRQGALRPLFSRGALPHLGQFSYAIYLVHVPLHRLVEPWLRPWVNQQDDPWTLPRRLAYTALVLAAAYMLSRGTWLLIEEPFLRLKDRWAPAKRTVPDPSVAALPH